MYPHLVPCNLNTFLLIKTFVYCLESSSSKHDVKLSRRYIVNTCVLCGMLLWLFLLHIPDYISQKDPFQQLADYLLLLNRRDDYPCRYLLLLRN